MMLVHVGPLPVELQNSNLCSVPEYVMDSLGLKPGGYLLVEGLPAQGEARSNSTKMSLTRLLVRRPATASGDSSEQLVSQEPEIQIDPSLMDYLGLKSGDKVRVASSPKEERISALTFEIERKFEPHEENKARLFIKKSCWPVYPRGEFAINLSGSTQLLRVHGEIQALAVVTPITAVTFLTTGESEELGLRQEILKYQTAVEYLKRQRAELEKRIKGMEREKSELDHRRSLVTNEKKRLENEIHTMTGMLREELPKRESDLKEGLRQEQEDKHRLGAAAGQARDEAIAIANSCNNLAKSIDEDRGERYTGELANLLNDFAKECKGWTESN